MEWLILVIVGAIAERIIRVVKQAGSNKAPMQNRQPVTPTLPSNSLSPQTLPQQSPPNTMPGQPAGLLYSPQRPLAGPPSGTPEAAPLRTGEQGRRRLEGLTPIQAKDAELRRSRQQAAQSTAQASSVAADFAEQRRLMDVEFSAAADEARLQTDGSIEDSMAQEANAARRRRPGNTSSTTQDSLLSPQSFLNAVMLSELLSKPRSRRT